jgi:predicted small lipoprotein YifL
LLKNGQASSARPSSIVLVLPPQFWDNSASSVSEPTDMNKRAMRSLVGVVLCLLVAAGCGQKGDLYFPKDGTAASQPLQQN